jgi:CBS-domain-containing membrane protein
MEVGMKARDVMVSPVITVEDTASVPDVAKIMVAKRISAVPVVDGAGKLVGIVTEADLMHRSEIGTERPRSWWVYFLSGDRAAAADYVKSHTMKISDIMTREVRTADPETALADIAELFEKHHIKRVPIVDKTGALVGIVSRANIIQAFASVRPKLEMALSDAAIRQRLLDELKKQPWTQIYKLNITVKNGSVDLWGIVDSEPERDAINAAAAGIPGVTVVNDHLVRASGFAY